ncbi:uncharacterized protein A4U43_C08F15710 [Asparagus officinalis]|uniref:auxin-responsive protein IAA20-like n=1 Tax=Asparagus officinalis TaxID=4686 RepID=UPI00098DF715|nr:auxin-responsive protein IAA20-like [Asparagus officinalis]ONK60223.1 uncharacterized protein A4U43_C08F15710 [Asparagus officinalis]
MELELGLALPNTNLIQSLDLNIDIAHCHKKRRSKRAFSRKDGDGDGDGGNNGGNIDPEARNNITKLQKASVGWPPIKCSRNIWVKVKMEGFAIGRKVDLSLLSSYQALKFTLHRMFPNKSYDNNNGDTGKQSLQSYMVTYEDEEGDWMLVGDIPWETFIRSVKRIKILGN